MPYPAATDFETVSGALRLGNKYGVEYIRLRALVHLSSNYFTTLSALDDSYPPRSSPWKKPSWSVTSFAVKVAAIELAREVDAVWMLPFAFYSLATGDNPLRKLLPRRIYSGHRSSLGAEDEFTFLEGSCVQRDTATTDLVRFLHFPVHIPGCTGGFMCAAARLRAMECVRKDRAGIFEGDPLYLWFGTDWDRLSDACRDCVGWMKFSHQQARQEFWDQLPAMYGLPNWRHMEKLKEAAIGRGE